MQTETETGKALWMGEVKGGQEGKWKIEAETDPRLEEDGSAYI